MCYRSKRKLVQFAKYYMEPTANTMLNSEGMDGSHQDQEEGSDGHTYLVIQDSTGRCSWSNKARKKSIQIEKEEIKQALFRGDMIV